MHMADSAHAEHLVRKSSEPQIDQAAARPIVALGLSGRMPIAPATHPKTGNQIGGILPERARSGNRRFGGRRAGFARASRKGLLPCTLPAFRYTTRGGLSAREGKAAG